MARPCASVSGIAMLVARVLRLESDREYRAVRELHHGSTQVHTEETFHGALKGCRALADNMSKCAYAARSLACPPHF